MTLYMTFEPVHLLPEVKCLVYLKCIIGNYSTAGKEAIGLQVGFSGFWHHLLEQSSTTRNIFTVARDIQTAS